MPTSTPTFCATLVMLIAAGSNNAVAQATDSLKQAAQKAVSTSPEVSARFNAYRAAVDAVDVGRAGWRPRVDLNANAGRESDRIGNRNPASDSLSRSAVGLSLNQLLWDGMGTSREIERLGHERLTRYFELLEATEQVALEAARAHLDVQRFRRKTTTCSTAMPSRRSSRA
jgi:outer membrane protein, adhesin transport system